MKTFELSAIGLKALELQQCIDSRKAASATLKDAYSKWKRENGCFQIDRNTAEWDRLMIATDPEFEALMAAKKAKKNASSRLSSACTRAMKGTAK